MSQAPPEMGLVLEWGEDQAVAEQYANLLAKDKDPRPRAMAAAVRAAIAFRGGDHPRADALIDEAFRGFDALGLGMYSVACRRSQGLIVGASLPRPPNGG